MNHTHSRTHQIVLAALFSALTVVLTLLFRVPIPYGQGYFNFGDAIVMLSAFVMGPLSGFWVGSIGSALADIIAGYAIYAPITFLVKGLEGLLVGWLFLRTRRILLSGLVGGIWMALGYMLGDWFLFGLAAAVAGLPLNLLQGIIGALGASVLYRAVGAIYKQNPYDHRRS